MSRPKDNLDREIERVDRKEWSRTLNAEGHTVSIFLLGTLFTDLLRVKNDPDQLPHLQSVTPDHDLEGDVDSIRVVTASGVVLRVHVTQEESS